MPSSILKLAKSTIETYLKTGQKLKVPKPLPKIFRKRAGIFVSLYNKKDKSLRGCIGTFIPVCENLAAELIKNAIAASVKDPRFQPMIAPELKDIEISVDVLSEPEPIKDLKDLNPKKYGVIVKSNLGAVGLLLPDLPQIDTPEKQTALACQKAGILANEPINLFRFTVKRYKE